MVSAEITVGIYIGAMIGFMLGYLVFKPDFLAALKAKISKTSLLDCWVVTKTGRLGGAVFLFIFTRRRMPFLGLSMSFLAGFR